MHGDLGCVQGYSQCSARRAEAQHATKGPTQAGTAIHSPTVTAATLSADGCSDGHALLTAPGVVKESTPGRFDTEGLS